MAPTVPFFYVVLLVPSAAICCGLYLVQPARQHTTSGHKILL